MPQTPLINGINYSWANIKFNLFGVPVIGITEINYSQKMKKDNNYGWGQYPISRGYGNVEPDGDITIYFDEWRKIIAASPSKDPNLIKSFDIQVLFGGSPLTFKQDTLRSAEFLDDPFTAKQGDTKLLIKIPLIIGLIEHTIP
jgi:hypothetical protein